MPKEMVGQLKLPSAHDILAYQEHNSNVGAAGAGACHMAARGAVHCGACAVRCMCAAGQGRVGWPVRGGQETMHQAAPDAQPRQVLLSPCRSCCTPTRSS